MIKLITTLTALFLTFFVSLSIAEEIRIATGQTFINAIFDPIRTPFKAQTGIDIRILVGAPAPALGELEKGNVEVAGASLPLDIWLDLSKKAGIAVKDISVYTTYSPLTEKGLVMVNNENKITALSKEQLKGIFTGKILNWNEVGGDDAPILIVWPTLSSGSLALFQSQILDNEPVTKSVLDVETMSDIPDAIAGSAEAIGIVNADTTRIGIKQVAPSIERPLTLAYKGKPSANLQKLLDFLKQDGKQYFRHRF